MLTGVATGVRNDAAAATVTHIRTGCGETPSSSAAAAGDRDDDERGGHVADELTERRRDEEQAGEQRVRPERLRRRRHEGLGDEVGGAGLGHRRRQRDHPGDEDDRRPRDRPVGALRRHDPEQDHRAGRQQPGDRRRHDPGREQDDHPDEDDDRLARPSGRAARPGGGRARRVDDEHVRVVEVLVERGPRALQQQRVADGEGRFAAQRPRRGAGSASTTRSPLSVTMPGKATSPIRSDRGGMTTSATPDVRDDERLRCLVAQAVLVDQRPGVAAEVGRDVLRRARREQPLAEQDDDDDRPR